MTPISFPDDPNFVSRLDQKMQQYDEELDTKYYHADEMRAEKIAQTGELHVRKSKFEQRRGQLQNHVHFLQIRADSKSQQLAEHETHQALLQLEGKIAQ